MSECLIIGPEFKDFPHNYNVSLLGNFCINDANRGYLQDRKYKVLGGCRDGLDVKIRDMEYIDTFYEKTLCNLALFFNKIHQTNHSVRYWRIIAGPWLSAIIPIVYNRWNKVSFAMQKDFDKVLGVKFHDTEIVPYDINDFHHIHLLHEWNSDLFSRIFEFKGVTVSPLNLEKSSILKRENLTFNFSSLFKKIVLTILSHFPKKENGLFMIHPYMSLVSQVKLQLSMSQIPYIPDAVIEPLHVAPDTFYREGINWNWSGDSDFEIFFLQYLKLAIPTLYVEGYERFNELAKKLPWPKRPKLIFTANAYYGSEFFKIWTARKVDKGVPYVIAQHGGAYGVEYFPHRTECHEKISSDFWLSWGWSDKSAIPFYNLKIFDKSIKIWDYKAKYILQVTNDLFPYSRHPWCSDHYNENYMNDQFDFFLHLREDISKNLVVRLHSKHAAYGSNQEKKWNLINKSVSINCGKSNIWKLINKSRIIVATYNATLFLETLSLNIPTVIFWNPEDNPVSERAELFFNMLKDVGILHDSPESAALHVSLVWDDIAIWWESETLQKSRIKFCQEYSRVDKDTLTYLKEFFNSSIKTLEL